MRRLGSDSNGSRLNGAQREAVEKWPLSADSEAKQRSLNPDGEQLRHEARLAGPGNGP